MNANELLKSVQNAVAALDLERVRAKLMAPSAGAGWDLKKTDAVEREYRRFLCLAKIYPQEELSPQADVDVFWHYHILDTMKYATDCEQVFGYFLHHRPHVSLPGDGDDEHDRLESAQRMCILYEATFGEADPDKRAGVPLATGRCGCGSQWETKKTPLTIQ